MKARTLLILLVGIFVFSGCWLMPEKVSLADPRLTPMIQAMAAVDRAALGFTEVPTNAVVRVEWHGPKGGYDAMLHIDAGTSRTIAFRKQSDGTYRWIGEQEIYRGPRIYETVDGKFNEQLVIDYELERVSPGVTGVPLKTVYISYSGEDPRLAWPKKITLQQARQVISEWKAEPNHQGGANGKQPLGSGTNSTAEAAASRRSP